MTSESLGIVNTNSHISFGLALRSVKWPLCVNISFRPKVTPIPINNSKHFPVEGKLHLTNVYTSLPDFKTANEKFITNK